MNFCHVGDIDDILNDDSGYDSLWENPKVIPTFCSGIRIG